MLKIRLKRIGSKKKPFYKIVIMENLSKRDGKSITEVGFYNPLLKIIKLDKIQILNYISNGAYPSNTVRHLIYKALN